MPVSTGPGPSGWPTAASDDWTWAEQACVGIARRHPLAKTQLANAVRNICHEEARLSGASPEREKAGLLPSRHGDDGLPATTAARRPADTWLPRDMQGDDEALDFACSSGLQASLVRQVGAEPGEVFDRYEELKRTHLPTADLCTEVGLRFTLCVLRAHGGGWNGAVRGFVGWMAGRTAATHHTRPEAESLRIAQRISLSLQREYARAVLRRLVPTAADTQASGWAELAADSGPW